MNHHTNLVTHTFQNWPLWGRLRMYYKVFMLTFLTIQKEPKSLLNWPIVRKLMVNAFLEH